MSWTSEVDSIKRTKECVRSLNVEEQLIVSTIQKLRNEAADEKAKAKLREQERAARMAGAVSTGVPAATEAGAPPFNNTTVQPVDDTIESIADITKTARKDGITPLLLTKERLPVKKIVRYGNVVMYEEEDDQGQKYPITVTIYIEYCMKNNDLRFKDALDKKIPNEAVRHKEEPDLNTEHYFMAHPDAAVSHLAVELASDRYQLCKVYEDTPTEEEELYMIVPYLMRNYNLELVKEETKKVFKDLQNPLNQQDPGKCMQLMQRYKELNIAENELNKQLGGRVINT